MNADKLRGCVNLQTRGRELENWKICGRRRTWTPGRGRKCSTGPERRITFFNVQEKEQRAQFEALAIAATK